MIECLGVTKKYDELVVLDDVSINVKDGEFLVILGPSGCGKTTLLQLIAGFMKPDSGKVLINKEELKKPDQRFGYVFQDYALFNWRTVLGNVMAGISRYKNKKEIALKMINKVGLMASIHKYPHQLSGGMKQRVGLARALAYNPEILLMDEPFGALDAQTRKMMQQELLNILNEFNKTVVFVTHSVVEAVYLADRVVVLSKSPAKILLDVEIQIHGHRDYLNKDFLTHRENILRILDTQTGINE